MLRELAQKGSGLESNITARGMDKMTVNDMPSNETVVKGVEGGFEK